MAYNSTGSGKGKNKNFGKQKEWQDRKRQKRGALLFRPFAELEETIALSSVKIRSFDGHDLGAENLAEQPSPLPSGKPDSSSRCSMGKPESRVATHKDDDDSVLKPKPFSERYGKVKIFLNPFEYPKSLPVQVFIKGSRDRFCERHIGRLMPLPYDIVVSDGDKVRIKERKKDTAVVYLDLKGHPIKIHGHIPYSISLYGGDLPDHARSFWAVRLPFSQNRERKKFRVVLKEPFRSESVIGREVEMVKYQWALPVATPESDAQELDGYQTAFQEAVRAERLIDVQDARLMEELNEKGERYDLRHRLIYTIDSEETQDIDDAVEVVRLSEKRFLLGIHIADVTEFVQEGADRDRDARNRGTSHYLADRVIHMLPECLSQEYCSLRPNKDRLAVSVYAEIEDTVAGYEVKGLRFCRSLIQSKAKLTYNQVEAVFNGKPSAVDDEIVISLRHARALAELIEFHSPYHDLSFGTGNVKYREDAQGRILRKGEPLGISDMLIEMFMVTANRLVGQKIADLILSTSAEPRGIGVYRMQKAPNDNDLKHYLKKLQRAQLVATDLQYDSIRSKVEQAVKSRTEPGEHMSPEEREALICSGIYREIQSFMDKTDPAVRMKWNVLERYAHKSGRLRQKAVLSANHQSSHHLSLGISRYAWFTSPIRRYADVVNHRHLKAILSRMPLVPSEVDVVALSGKINDGSYAENALLRRLLYYYLCHQEGLLEAERLTVSTSSFQWVMWQDWAIEIQGIWKDLYPVHFVVEDVGRNSQILDDGLTCQLRNGLTVDIGDAIVIHMNKTNSGLDPAKGAVCIVMGQIEKA